MIYTFCELVPAFAVLLAETLTANPCTPESPWGMIWYADEAVPGQVLSPDNRRKSTCFYWTFVQFGLELLSRAAMWFYGGLIRTDLVEDVGGGISRVFRHFMEVLLGFVDPSINIQTSGPHA